jgi:acetyl esterase
MRAMSVDTLPTDLREPVGGVEDTVAGSRPARLYRPEGHGPFSTLVYFHGGGFVLGDLDTHDQLCRRICAGAKTVVVSVDYRLAPEHPFPAAVNDALEAVTWASSQRRELGGTDLVAVGGDSAGANLAAVVAQAHPDRVAAQVLIYPATDPFGSHPSRHECGYGYFLEAVTVDWFMGHYLSAHAAEDDLRHSPLLAPPHVLSRQPPTLVATAEFDPLRDEGEAYADALRDTGVHVDYQCYEAMIHGFADMGHLSRGARAATDDLIHRIRDLLRRVP